MSPHAEGKKGTRHTDIVYTGGKKARLGEEQPRNYVQTYNGATTNTRDPRACGQQKTADCKGLPTLAPRMHWRMCMNKQRKKQGSADSCRMHWRKCLTKHRWA